MAILLLKNTLNMNYAELSPKEEDVGRAVVNAAFKVHSVLGPGLLEKIYEICLVHELQKAGYEARRQVVVPIEYDGIAFEEALRMDVIVEDIVIAEIKSVEQVNPVWRSQVLSHLKLTNRRLGYVLNFNVSQIKDGIKRVIR
jgi:GxxExxY protein